MLRSSILSSDHSENIHLKSTAYPRKIRKKRGFSHSRCAFHINQVMSSDVTHIHIPAVTAVVSPLA